MVIFLAGSAKDRSLRTARIRSRASLTALSGRPTMAKPGNPGLIAHSTSTSRGSIPSKVTVWARVIIKQKPWPKQFLAK